jgi:hypothetical protein
VWFGEGGDKVGDKVGFVVHVNIGGWFGDKVGKDKMGEVKVGEDKGVLTCDGDGANGEASRRDLVIMIVGHVIVSNSECAGRVKD